MKADSYKHEKILTVISVPKKETIYPWACGGYGNGGMRRSSLRRTTVQAEKLHSSRRSTRRY